MFRRPIETCIGEKPFRTNGDRVITQYGVLVNVLTAVLPFEDRHWECPYAPNEYYNRACEKALDYISRIEDSDGFVDIVGYCSVPTALMKRWLIIYELMTGWVDNIAELIRHKKDPWDLTDPQLNEVVNNMLNGNDYRLVEDITAW